jgi:predicted pyridoxine 5'-phosphate oxidase superfamily flavin-nucleotide-binding protein/truncated hemoglobin YjbI
MFRLFKSKAKPIPNDTAPLTLLPGSEGEHALQEKYGTRQRALRFYDKQVLNFLSPVMKEFITTQEILFISTSDKHGECDCSFRFGKPGFVRILNDHYLAYPEYRGNGVLASQGNITENPHIGMIFVDFFASTVGLHVNGKAKVIENEDLLKFRAELSPDIIAEINTEGRFRPERWIMVEIEEAYIHCSKHVPLLKKADKEISWGTDDDSLKRSDFFCLQDFSLYRRLGGDMAIQAIADALTLRLTLDDSIRPLLKDISLQTLLDRQKFFLKAVFGGFETEHELPENLHEFYRQQTSLKLDEVHLHKALTHLKETLADLDVPEHEIGQLFARLESDIKV